MFKNVASKLAIFAFDTTTGAAKTGDAANLTAYVSKDYGAVTVLGDTSATEMDATNAKGWYLFDLAQAETNADACLFTGKSTTANISLVGQLVFTTPANFSTLSVDSNGRVDVIKVAGTTQTARDLGASVLVAGDFSATMKTSLGTAIVTELNTTTYAEPAQGAPGATITLAAKIGYLYKAFRNKATQTATTYSLYNDDAATVDHKATVSDDATTFTRGEIATGP